MGMTFDAARSEVVMFGGVNGGGLRDDTWTWDGTTWTRRYPATSPSARFGEGMTYDAVHGQVVLFGACCDRRDTWTWDGTTWTRQHPPTSPSARGEMGLAYDAARGDAVLFGGNSDDGGRLGDTWTWDGTHWRVPFVAHLHLSPRSGSPGTSVRVKGTGFAAGEQVTLTFIDSVAGKTILGRFTTEATGSLNARVTIPISATMGTQRITGAGAVSLNRARTTFTVT
jgi:hypothetical protein